MDRSRHSRASFRQSRRGRGFALCVVILAFAAAIPLGSVGFLESRLVAALAWLAGTVGLAWAGPRGGNERSIVPRLAAVAVALLLAWCGWQLLPLPVGWVSHFWRGNALLFADILADASRSSIALDRFASLHALLLWAGLGMMAWACSRWLRGRWALLTALYGLVFLGLFQSMMGLFFLKDPAGRICGTFGSPNALGGLLAMVLPVTLGLVLFHSSRRSLRGRTGFRWWLHRLSDSGRAWLRPILWTTWGIQWVAMYFTGSIGATVSAAAACGILMAWQGKERPETRPYIAALGALLAVLVLAFGIHARKQNVLDRALGDSGEFQRSKASRVEIWRSAWRLCRTFPFGTGPGGTVLALPMFQTAVHGSNRLDYAHNDTLQYLGDLGLPGFMPLAFLLALVLWRGAQASRLAPSRGGGDPVWLIRGAWLATLAALIHAQVEFNLSARPGNQWVFAILCGILWGSSASLAPVPLETDPPARQGLRIGIRPCALVILGAIAGWVSLSAAAAWRLREGAAIAVGLPVDQYLWFRRPVIAPEAVPEALRRACRLAPGAPGLRRTSAEARLALHGKRSQATALSLLPSDGGNSAAGAPVDPMDPAFNRALGLASVALRVEEAEMLRAALADADAAVRLAPWDAGGRLVRGSILLRGASLKQFGPDAETRGRRELELAVGLYPMDAGVLAGACSSLSCSANSDRDKEILLDWGSRALALDASLAWTVLDAWWTGHVRAARVLELPQLPVAVLWNLYARLDQSNRTQDARRCLVALERRLETDQPPEASSLWTPSMWRRWNLRQSQYRIRLASEWLKRNLKEGNWEGVAASAASRARARHDRFQVELDKMELSGTASAVLRRLRLREWAATGGLSPDWTLEWVLLELEASTPIQRIQESLAEMILMDGLDVESLGRLRACRPALTESPLLTSLLAAQEAESSGRPEEAIAMLAPLLETGRVPSRLVHRVWIWRSRLLHRIGDDQAATEALNEAARICPSDPDGKAALAGIADKPGSDWAHATPELDLGFAGGRLLLKQAFLDTGKGPSPETRLHLLWRFQGGLPPDLQMGIHVRDEDGHVRARGSAAVDQEEAAKFNRGHPSIGSTWTWTVPLSSFAAKGRMVEVRLRSAGKTLPSDDGLAVLELNLEKLPRAVWADGQAPQ